MRALKLAIGWSFAALCLVGWVLFAIGSVTNAVIAGMFLLFAIFAVVASEP